MATTTPQALGRSSSVKSWFSRFNDSVEVINENPRRVLFAVAVVYVVLVVPLAMIKLLWADEFITYYIAKLNRVHAIWSSATANWRYDCRLFWLACWAWRLTAAILADLHHCPTGQLTSSKLGMRCHGICSTRQLSRPWCRTGTAERVGEQAVTGRSSSGNLGGESPVINADVRHCQGRTLPNAVPALFTPERKFERGANWPRSR